MDTPRPKRGQRLVACLVATLVLCTLIARPAGAVRPVSRAKLTFRTEAGIATEDRDDIKEGLRLAQDFFDDSFGIDVAQPVIVVIQRGASAPASAYANEHTLTFSTEHSVWRDSSALHRTKIAIHEYFHVLQSELDGGRQPGPRWLLEGSAEYVAWQAVVAQGLVDESAVRDRWVGGALHGPTADVPLDQLAFDVDPSVACCLYEVAPLAVGELVASVGIKALRAYYTAIGTGTPWADAFAKAFGQTPEEFYDVFAGVRAGLVWSGSDQSRIRYPASFADGTSFLTLDVYPDRVARGDQGLIASTATPGIRCTLTLASSGGKRLLTRATHALPDGTVFWLWSVLNAFGQGPATAEADCGADPVTISIEIR
jgi:hypothetical protein